MTFTCATRAKLVKRFEEAAAKLAPTRPADARILRNILGAVHGGYVRGPQLTLAHRLVRQSAV